MSFVYHSYVLICHSYVIHMLLVCTSMLSVCTRMYVFIRMLIVCSRVSSVCHVRVLVCDSMPPVCIRISSSFHPYILLYHPYVTRMSFACHLVIIHRVELWCHFQMTSWLLFIYFFSQVWNILSKKNLFLMSAFLECEDVILLFPADKKPDHNVITV